jgi:hypothetical protein
MLRKQPAFRKKPAKCLLSRLGSSNIHHPLLSEKDAQDDTVCREAGRTSPTPAQQNAHYQGMKRMLHQLSTMHHE